MAGTVLIFLTCLVYLIVNARNVNLEYRFHVTSSGYFSTEAKNRLYLTGDNLQVLCQICDPNNENFTSDDRQRLLHEFEMLDRTPSLTISNSTWTSTWEFPMTANKTMKAWELVIPRSSITQDFTGYAAVEQWTVLVELGTGSGLFQTYGTLLDAQREPVLQWSWGQQVLGLLSPPSHLVAFQSTCARDEVIIIPKWSGQPAGLYLGLSYTGLTENNITWFDLQGDGTLCTLINCTEVELLDGILTNHNLILLTTAGLLVSQDMTNKATLWDKPQINFQLVQLTYASPAQAKDMYRSAKLTYTPSCSGRESDESIESDEVSITLGNDVEGNGTFHSKGPAALQWELLYNVSTLPHHAQSIQQALYNIQTETYVTLYTTQTGTWAVEVRRLLAGGTLNSHAFFAPFSFPQTFNITGVAFHPDSGYLYAYGNQVWLSDDGGNSFSRVHSLANDSIINFVPGPQDGAVVMVTLHGNILYGKAGVYRMAELPAALSSNMTLMFDQLGILYIIHLSTNGNTVQRTVFNVEDHIQVQDVAFAHPLAAQHILENEVLLFEHAPLQATATSSRFSNANVGQLLSLKKEGSAIIREVTHSAPPTGYLATIKAYLLTPFTWETLQESPAQNFDIEIFDWSYISGKATLVLTSYADPNLQGWLTSDLGKTAVLPGMPSFLLTQHINSSHAIGQATMYTTGMMHHAAGYWWMYDFGYNDSQNVLTPMWTLNEDQCRHQMTVDPGLIHRTYTLDIKESVTLSVLASTRGTGPVDPGMGRPLVYITFTNPWLMKIASKLDIDVRGQHNLSVTVTNEVIERGMTVARFHLPQASLRCKQVNHLIRLHAGCPCNKRLIFWYPQYISQQDFLHGNPVDMYGISLLKDLQINYRPPSSLGIDIPVSEHIYNADPSQPRPKDALTISQTTGHFKQCKGKTNRTQCGCTEAMQLSARAKFSDCRRRAYLLRHPGKITLKFTIRQPEKPEVDVGDEYLFSVKELNDREITLETADSVLLTRLGSSASLSQGGQLVNPKSTTITLTGSGLYHFRAEMVVGQSYCKLDEEFMVYVDASSIAHPLPYLIKFSVGVLIGGILFVIYLWYLSKHHVHRIRKTGLRCPSLHCKQSGYLTGADRHERCCKIREAETAKKETKM